MKLMKRVLCVMMIAVLLLCGCGSTALAAKQVAVKTVKLNKTSCTVYTDNCIRLTASIAPSNATNKKITWSSSNTKVAKVSQQGVVEGVGAGTATITAKASNGKKASCKVTVKIIEVSKVSFPQSAVTAIGKTQLNATVSPANATNRKLTWSSSNTRVATVDKNGLVTPTGYGTATITAKAHNGKKDTCKVTVSKDLKITKSYTVAQQDMYKAIDTMVILVDGKTGKIRSTDCYQNKSDLTFIIGATISRNGIKAYNVRDDYVDFRASWAISINIGFGKLSLSAGDVVTRTNSYRLYKDGRLVMLDASCTDWIGLCKR